MVLAFFQLVHAFSCRSDQASVFSLGLWTNRQLGLGRRPFPLRAGRVCVLPWTRDVFHLAPLYPFHWMVIASRSAVPLAAMEVWKTVHRYEQRRSRT
ncbi:cation transporting ATPase C-terminal domain-containing protein [Nitrospira sp. Nam80]